MSSKIDLVECDACPTSGGCVNTCMKAAPVVERQPVEVLGYSVVGNRYAIAATKGEIIELHEGYADHMIELVYRKHVTRLQAEFAELQATISRLTSKMETMCGKNNELNDTVARLTAENERLKGGQSEPMAYTTFGMIEIAKRLPLTGRIGAKTAKDEWWNVALYTSQPAPVPVPDGWKLVPIESTDDMTVAFAEGWYSKR